MCVLKILVCVLSHVWFFATPRTIVCQASLSLGIFQARILEWVAIPFLQGLFRTQVWNPGLLQYRQILHHLSHQGSPMVDFNLLFFSYIYFSYLFIWLSQVLVASHRAFHCGTQTLAGACGLMWDLRSPTRDCIPVPYIARWFLPTEPPQKSLQNSYVET